VHGGSSGASLGDARRGHSQGLGALLVEEACAAVGDARIAAGGRVSACGGAGSASRGDASLGFCVGFIGAGLLCRAKRARQQADGGVLQPDQTRPGLQYGSSRVGPGLGARPVRHKGLPVGQNKEDGLGQLRENDRTSHLGE
jgi:hypothetical protein